MLRITQSYSNTIDTNMTEQHRRRRKNNAQIEMNEWMNLKSTDIMQRTGGDFGCNNDNSHVIENRVN